MVAMALTLAITGGNDSAHEAAELGSSRTQACTAVQETIDSSCVNDITADWNSLFFLLQSPIVCVDECADLIGQAQKLFPLLAIECDWKTS